MALPGPRPPNSSKRPSMHDRDLAAAVLIAGVVCCGGSALLAGLVGGVALAAIGRFSVVSAVGLGAVVSVAWAMDRRRHRGDGDTDERTTDLEGSKR